MASNERNRSPRSDESGNDSLPPKKFRPESVSTSLRIRTIFQLWLEIKQNRPCDVMHHVKDFVEKHFKRVLLESEQQKIKLTVLKFSKNWCKYHRIRDRFETELSDWLDSELFCEIICNEASTSRKGRPNVSYEEGSMRTKRRRLEELVASTSSEALKKAAERLTGSNTNEKISVESALALYIDMDLSMRQYNMMRKVVNSIHKDCFPSYYMIAEAKKKVESESDDSDSC